MTDIKTDLMTNIKTDPITPSRPSPWLISRLTPWLTKIQNCEIRAVSHSCNVWKTLLPKWKRSPEKSWIQGQQCSDFKASLRLVWYFTLKPQKGCVHICVVGREIELWEEKSKWDNVPDLSYVELSELQRLREFFTVELILQMRSWVTLCCRCDPEWHYYILYYTLILCMWSWLTLCCRCDPAWHFLVGLIPTRKLLSNLIKTQSIEKWKHILLWGCLYISRSQTAGG